MVKGRIGAGASAQIANGTRSPLILASFFDFEKFREDQGFPLTFTL